MTDLAHLSTLLAAPDQPHTLFRALDAALRQAVGHILFTLLVSDPARGEVARVYTNQPAAYPVGGRKPMAETAWGDLVLRQGKPYLGRTAKDIEWAFFDHALIARLGCASVINAPVIYDGRCIGTLNVLDAEGHYGEADMATVAAFAPLVIPAFLVAAALHGA